MSFTPKAAIQAMNREKGRKGGTATAQKHTTEWLQARGHRGGSVTRDLYGAEYFRYINAKRKVRKGWPKGKLRKPIPIPVTVKYSESVQKWLKVIYER